MPEPTISKCRELFDRASDAELSILIERFAQDERSGVRSLVVTASRRLEASRKESTRLRGMAELEASLRAQGASLVAGVDEVGRGAIAGPVTAAAVVLPPGTLIDGLDDSKRLKPEQRSQIAVDIRATALTWHVAHVSAQDVDRMGIAAATKQAMAMALQGLDPAPDHVIVDGLPVGVAEAETAVVGGDSKVAAIAAASIIAKVTRDLLMVSLAQEHPVYGFDINKGYGTAEHMQAVASHGLCPLHRRSFSPCGGTASLF